ncbi:MAG: 4a-hydroxytetrahydrobiopterin dehydratase [Herminiimonas sp.]|nr:4a-hydroxytetrahydrobiopterin dehydratase [Herminiimonas sp.]
MITTSALTEKKCRHLDTGLRDAELPEYLAAVPGWTLRDAKLTQDFAFKNYHETLAFINAIAYVIHAEDHHPELVVTYSHCVVKFDTHSINGGTGGISENDFICAAKVGAIYQQSFS